MSISENGTDQEGPHATHLTIRTARPKDEQAVVALWRACELIAVYNDPAVDFRLAKAGPASEVLVGEDPEGVLRSSVMVGHDGHRGWLYYVAIDPERRHMGYGRLMVGAGEAWLHERGILKVQLLVRETNAAVISFYERLGFEIAPRTVMTKWLPGAPSG